MRYNKTSINYYLETCSSEQWLSKLLLIQRFSQMDGPDIHSRAYSKNKAAALFDQFDLISDEVNFS
jgi:hypothetical protein